jgi:hypothetical protein
MSDGRTQAVIAAGIVQWGLPENEAEAMALARWAYGQGYLNGLTDRRASQPQAEGATERAPR